jgi:hypothetical protein
MHIAILAWGSLVWDPRGLPITGEWNTDGPQLPIELARVSRDGRLTFVIHAGVPPVTTYWVRLTAMTVAEAREQLRQREGTVDRFIGSVPPRTRAEPTNEITQTIDHWRKRRGLDGVIWTQLPANFEDAAGYGQALTAENAVKYLLSLPPEERRLAETYIRKAPVQTQTPLRQIIAQRLGWHPHLHT